ncbi:glycosyltransferase [Williamsia sp. MIQD14]|uniref:glycosyltransferase n=1 Tax=Williamsia sp. MIQD14 TaxID=3425703 RepID=UPI003D9FEBF0
MSTDDRPARQAPQRRILVVDQFVPDPLLGAGLPRAHQIVSSFVEAGFRVDHYPMWSKRSERRRMASLFGRRVRFRRGQGRLGLWNVLRTDGADYDAIFVSRPPTMQTVLAVGWKPRWGPRRPPVIYDAEALFAVREKLRRALYPPVMSEAEYHEELLAELQLMSEADAVTTAGSSDAAAIRSGVDIPTHVLPHATTARPDLGATFDDRRDILFVGRLAGPPDLTPNVDSVRYFVREIMPVLDGLIGNEYVVHVAGMVDSPEIEALRSERVVVLGVVEDLGELYERCRVFVAPTRYSAGIPLKVVEAMSQGIPSIVTPQLADQLEVHEPTVAIGDGTEGFARACAQLYTDGEQWQATRDSALTYVADACSPEVFRQRLVEVVDAAIVHAAQRQER